MSDTPRSTPTPSNPLPEPLLDPDDLVRIFRVSRPTINLWTRSGALSRPVRVGRNTLRWTAASIREFIAARQQEGGAV